MSILIYILDNRRNLLQTTFIIQHVARYIKIIFMRSKMIHYQIVIADDGYETCLNNKIVKHFWDAINIIQTFYHNI